jgi:ElaB/YqjD/DUF883 family membrane-anchored ribosome-binding protein
MQTSARGNGYPTVSGRSKPAIDQVADMAHEAVDKAIGAVAPSADWLSGQGERLNTSSRRVIENTSTCIADNPLKSIGIAVLAGFLLSRILR